MHQYFKISNPASAWTEIPENNVSSLSKENEEKTFSLTIPVFNSPF